MLHEVRIYGADGALKKIVHEQDVTAEYWAKIRRGETVGIRQMRGKQTGAKHVKKNQG